MRQITTGDLASSVTETTSRAPQLNRSKLTTVFVAELRAPINTRDYNTLSGHTISLMIITRFKSG